MARPLRIEFPGAVYHVIDEDRLAPLSTSSNVIDGAGEFYAQRSGHAGTLRRERAKGKA